jgi:hypothetical protein
MVLTNYEAKEWKNNSSIDNKITIENPLNTDAIPDDVLFDVVDKIQDYIKGE